MKKKKSVPQQKKKSLFGFIDEKDIATNKKIDNINYSVDLDSINNFKTKRADILFYYKFIG